MKPADTLAPRSLLQALKARAGGACPLCLAVGRPVEALLRPVATRADRVNLEDVDRLTEWRNLHVSSFLTEFVATRERTVEWLTEQAGPDDTRILFMVEAPPGKVTGYMGLAFIDWATGSAEADAVVRGGEMPRGLMSRCLRHLLGWARDQLGLGTLSVRVRSDNPALAFYEKFGFKETRREPLVKLEEEGGIVWKSGESATNRSEVCLVHMGLPD